MKMHVISSGSKGNASIIYDETTTILIDMGITLKRLKEGLNEVNKSLDDIDYCLFTHDHSDHIKGVDFLDKNLCFSRVGTINLLQIISEIEAIQERLMSQRLLNNLALIQVNVRY